MYAYPIKRVYTKRTTYAVSDAEGILLFNLSKEEARKIASEHEGWDFHSVSVNWLRPRDRYKQVK